MSSICTTALRSAIPTAHKNAACYGSCTGLRYGETTIKLINNVAEAVNSDPDVGDLLRSLSDRVKFETICRQLI